MEKTSKNSIHIMSPFHGPTKANARYTTKKYRRHSLGLGRVGVCDGDGGIACEHEGYERQAHKLASPCIRI